MHKIIDIFVNKIKDFPDVEKVILYGSRARGDNSSISDIDLAISCPNISVADWVKLVNIANEADTLLDINLVQIESAPKELIDNIKKDGKLLYDKRKTSI